MLFPTFSLRRRLLGSVLLFAAVAAMAESPAANDPDAVSLESARAEHEAGRAILIVRYVNGGMSEWARRGWPTVRPPP